MRERAFERAFTQMEITVNILTCVHATFQSDKLGYLTITMQRCPSPGLIARCLSENSSERVMLRSLYAD